MSRKEVEVEGQTQSRDPSTPARGVAVESTGEVREMSEIVDISPVFGQEDAVWVVIEPRRGQLYWNALDYRDMIASLFEADTREVKLFNVWYEYRYKRNELTLWFIVYNTRWMGWWRSEQ